MPKPTEEQPQPKKAALREASGFTCFTLVPVQHPLLGWNSLEDDGRHGNLKEFLLEGNEGQQTSVEQAKQQEDTLGTEDGGNVRVLQEPGERFSVILVDFDSVAIKFTHQCMSTITPKRSGCLLSINLTAVQVGNGVLSCTDKLKSSTRLNYQQDGFHSGAYLPWTKHNFNLIINCKLPQHKKEENYNSEKTALC